MGYGAEDTRRQIFTAATAEFAEHGLSGAKVDRIAAAAQANKQAIYLYYRNKEKLFAAVDLVDGGMVPISPKTRGSAPPRACCSPSWV
ncbi:TetR/AcrR family transcriptional regulator [Streptomyces sp. NPDC052051]|uniref:TetR/AcrR family transcriptional regulator n=1 Tax=Streptomyces sp. NPDC052051 TaxID=3154649 RepID=UPI00341B795B